VAYRHVVSESPGCPTHSPRVFTVADDIADAAGAGPGVPGGQLNGFPARLQ
jgi:hypothetical protein